MAQRTSRFLNSNYVNPAFQLGLMLGDAYGDMWATNAKNRQLNRGNKLVDEMMNGDPYAGITLEDIPVSMDAENGVNMGSVAQQEPASVTGNMPTFGEHKYLGLDSSALQSLPKVGQQAVSAEGIMLQDIPGQNEGSAVAAPAGPGTTLADVSAAARSTPLWQPRTSADEIREALRADGLNQEVIDQIMPGVEKKIANEATRNMLPNILDLAYEGGADNSRKAYEQIIALSEYNAPLANSLIGTVPSAKELWTASNTAKAAAAKAAAQAQEKKEDRLFTSRENNKKIAARYGNGGGQGGGGKTKSILESAEFKYADKRLGEIENLLSVGGELSPELEAERKQLKSVKQAILEEAGLLPKPQIFEPNWNDYPQVIRFATGLFDKGATVEQVSKILRDKMGDGPMYRSIVGEWPNGGTEEKTVSQQKPQQPAEPVNYFYRADDPNSVVNRLKNKNYGENGMTIINARG